MNRRHTSTKYAATLLEVMIGATIVFIISIGIISTIIAGIYHQQSIREQDAATRLAATMLESSKRELFNSLNREVVTNVTIDNRGTPETDDDITGTAALRFYSLDGSTEYGVGANPLPNDQELVRAEATVIWNPAGRGSENRQTVTLSTLLAPSS